MYKLKIFLFVRSDKITVSLKMEPDSIFDEFSSHTNPMCGTGINCSFDQSDPKCDISAIEPSQKKSRISEFLLQTVTLSEKKYPFFHIEENNKLYVYKRDYNTKFAIVGCCLVIEIIEKILTFFD
jgi:hypothetical protein